MQPTRSFILGILVVIAALSVAAIAVSKDDRSQLQGKWERALVVGSDSHGAVKAVKEIKGDRETVSYLAESGDVVYTTTASFKVEHIGRVKLYTTSNIKVTKGKNAGESLADSDAAVYRVEGDKIHEAYGVLNDSHNAAKPNVVTWKRAM